VNLGGLLNNLSFANIIGGILFSGIGYVAFMYGKKTMNVQLMMVGGALMLYCMFVSETLWLYVAGVGLTVAAYFARNAD